MSSTATAAATATAAMLAMIFSRIPLPARCAQCPRAPGISLCMVMRPLALPAARGWAVSVLTIPRRSSSVASRPGLCVNVSDRSRYAHRPLAHHSPAAGSAVPQARTRWRARAGTPGQRRPKELLCAEEEMNSVRLLIRGQKGMPSRRPNRPGERGKCPVQYMGRRARGGPSERCRFGVATVRALPCSRWPRRLAA